MRKNFGKKSWLYPMPVLIVAAYDEAGVPNAMNAAWGGIFTDVKVTPYNYIFISSTVEADFTVNSTHAGRNPLFIAFLADFRFDHAQQ